VALGLPLVSGMTATVTIGSDAAHMGWLKR
jgi:hypothetical protein